ncbi:hypothetical protein C0989_004429 [Termitomyces sp. Mn162]|nr:hypothetical protein C0989_004429 [Termitomyces sp. Mn162]
MQGISLMLILTFWIPSPQALPHKEALYENVQGVGCELQEEDGCKFAGAPDPESPDKTTEAGDMIYATMFHPPSTLANIWARQTTSQQMAKAFAASSYPKPFCNMFPHYLHNFEDVFLKASINSLPECKQWDHAIELLPSIELLLLKSLSTCTL